jgi:hypothetical protein
VIGILSAIVWIGWGGFALAKLWGWFLVPLGVMPITWWHAGGLFSVQTLISGGGTTYAWIAALKSMNVESKHSKWLVLFMSIVIPATTLGTGWLVKAIGPIVDAAL